MPNNKVLFNITPAEKQDILGALLIFREGNDRGPDGKTRTDTERTVNAVADILGDKIASELRDHMATSVVVWTEVLSGPKVIVKRFEHCEMRGSLAI